MTKDKKIDIKKEVDAEEPELYVEPPKLTGRDALGVILALVALVVIGIGGYIWLNPQLSAASLFKHQQPAASAKNAASTTAPAAGTTNAAPGGAGSMPGMDMSGQTTDQNSQSSATTSSAPAAETSTQEQAKAPAESTAAAVPASESAAAETKPEHFICDFCGMFADSSRSYVIAQWTDGMTSHHDSWDCVSKYGKANKMTLASAKVLDFTSQKGAPVMLDAAGAWYLYKTKKSVSGSMPPNVAAYASRAAAEKAQPAMGGETLDFAGLKAKWE